MKFFADINLSTVNLNSEQELQTIYNAFKLNYCQHYIQPDETNAELVVTYLNNFLRANNITRCATQELALVLKYLPSDDELISSINKNDTLTLLVLKINLRQAGCPDSVFTHSDFKQRCALITKLKKKICFHDDWNGYVERVVDAFNRKSFELAQIKLAAIAPAAAKKNIQDKAYLPFMLSMQICQYITILQFIDKQQLDIFDEFKELVNALLKQNLDKLCHMQEPKNEEETTKTFGFKLKTMLFSCNNTQPKYNQVAPELSEPLLLEQKLGLR